MSLQVLEGMRNKEEQHDCMMKVLKMPVEDCVCVYSNFLRPKDSSDPQTHAFSQEAILCFYKCREMSTFFPNILSSRRATGVCQGHIFELYILGRKNSMSAIYYIVSKKFAPATRAQTYSTT